MTLEDKKAKLDERIKICDGIDDTKKMIRGVYGVFTYSKGRKEAIYIGRAIDIRRRFFDYGGHLTSFIWPDSQYNKECLVANLIQEALNTEKYVKIEVIQEVPFEFDNYNRDLQRLAYVEAKLIEKYQRQGQALKQKPEGNWISEEKWKAHKKEQSRGI